MLLRLRYSTYVTKSESWLPVVDYEDSYEVSDQGRVRSISRVVVRRNGSPMPYNSQPISPFRSPPSNYLTVSLKRGGQKRNRRIHVLVAEAFVGRKPFPAAEVCHSNGDKDDNRPCNLYWGTRSQNVLDAVRHRTHNQVSKTHCKRNHAFTPENTYINPTSGGRQCKRCVYEGNRRRMVALRIVTTSTSAPAPG